MLLQEMLAKTHYLAVNAIILIIFLYVPFEGKTQNLLVNGGFEIWPITGEWTNIGTGITPTQEMLTFFEGTSSCRVNVVSTDQTLMDFRQTIDVVAGVDYSISVRVFQEDNQARARLYVAGFTGVYSDENTTGVWQELTYSFVPPISGPIDIGFRFYDVPANWTGGPSNILIDAFSFIPTPGIVANQFEFLRTAPTNAGVGLPFELIVCATDGNSVESTYVNPLILSDNGSTASYTIAPTSTLVPSSGCVTYTITPTSTGSILLDVGNGDFTNLQTASILVEVLGVPSVAYSTEIYDTDATPTTSTSDLNNLWAILQGDSCTTIAGGTFQPVYGSLSYDPVSHIGTISGLVDMVNGSAGVPYTGNATFRLINLDGPLKGTHFVTNGGNLSANPNVMQANSPKPSEISVDQHYTENTGSLVAKNAIAFSFDPPVSDFGVWVGDVETNPLGTNAEVLLFYEDALLAQVPILTSSSLAEQMNTGGTGCGSSDDYAGCGNHSTRWVECSGALFTDVMIVVGDDDVAGPGLSEHISFGGVSIGGTCDVVLLNELDWQLQSSVISEGILVNWRTPIFARVSVEKRTKTGDFEEVFSDNDLAEWLDLTPDEGWNAYRLRWEGEDGQIGYTSLQRVYWSGIDKPMLFPNPAQNNMTLQWEDKPLSYTIWNYQGQLIQKGILSEGKGNISLKSLPMGRYICQVVSGMQIEIIPFLVVKK